MKLKCPYCNEIFLIKGLSYPWPDDFDPQDNPMWNDAIEHIAKHEWHLRRSYKKRYGYSITLIDPVVFELSVFAEVLLFDQLKRRNENGIH